MRRIVSTLLIVAGLLAVSPVSAESACTVRRPRTSGTSRAYSGSGARQATPHFPNTKTHTITTGKLHYINPPKPATR